MKVLMLTLGTRGDVQPYVALALELEKAGHEAILAAPEKFEAFVSGYGVRFAALDDGPMRLTDTAGGREAMQGGVRARVALAKQLPKLFGRVLEDAWAAASEGEGAGADVVVHNGQVLAGQHVAEKLGVPAVLASPIPMYVPTREFPWPGQSLPVRLPAAMNRVTFLGMKAASVAFGRTVDAWRERTLGLARRPLRRTRWRRARRGEGDGPRQQVGIVRPYRQPELQLAHHLPAPAHRRVRRRPRARPPQRAPPRPRVLGAPGAGHARPRPAQELARREQRPLRPGAAEGLKRVDLRAAGAAG